MTSVSSPTMQNICLAIGKIVSAKPNKTKTPSYFLKLDFGKKLIEEHNSKYNKSFYASSAQLCSNYSPETLMTKKVLCVINFPRKQIGKHMSDCLVTGVQQVGVSKDDKRKSTVIVQPSHEVDLGSRVSITGQKQIVESNARDLDWTSFCAKNFVIETIVELTFQKENDKFTNQPDKINKFAIKLAENKLGIGFLHPDFDEKTLLKTQALFLKEKNMHYLCSVGGAAVLIPSKHVENGFKLA